MTRPKHSIGNGAQRTINRGKFQRMRIYRRIRQRRVRQQEVREADRAVFFVVGQPRRQPLRDLQSRPGVLDAHSVSTVEAYEAKIMLVDMVE